MKAVRPQWLLTVLFISVIFLSTANAKEDGLSNVGNQGYSLVSYFESETAEIGSIEFNAVFEGKDYWFTSKQQVEKFKADPERYLPKFGELCPYSLALGRKVAIDPTNFKIIGGQLLLFHRSDELDGLNEWNKVNNDKDLLEQAQGKFELLRF